MSRQPTPTLAATGQPDPADQYFQTILHGLVAMANDMACQIHAQAMAQAPAPKPAPEATPAATQAATQAPAHAAARTDGPAQPAPDLTIQFDRIARAIRRTILLSRSIAQPAPARAAADPDLAEARLRAEARQPILRTVERLLAQAGIRALAYAGRPARRHAENHADDDGRPEPGNRRDRPNAPDRLDAPDRPEALRNRSDADILTEILLDLGLAAPPARRRHWRRKAASTGPGAAADPLPSQPRQNGPGEARQQALPPSPAPTRDTRPGDG